MHKLKFDLIEKGNIIHRKNREDFIDNEKSIFHKNNDVCVLFLCYNSYNAFEKCYKYLKNEKNQNFDIIISDNSTDEKNIQQFYEIGKKDKQITILKTIDNLGCSAGFSLGMEYAIKSGYKYLIMFEDDIIPIDNNIISSMITVDNFQNKIIYNKHNYSLNKGGPFHLVGYPITLLAEKGVIDPRYFLKCDDGDLWYRVEKKYKNITILNNYYYHPLRKKNFFKNRVLACAVRSGLMLTRVSDFRYILRQIIYTYMYIRYGFSKLFMEGDSGVLNIVNSSILSFILGTIGFQENTKLQEKRRNIKITKPKNLKEKIISRKEFNRIAKNRLFLFAMLTGGGNWHAFGKIEYSKSLKDGIKNGILAGGVYDPLYPIIMLFKNIIFLEEEDFLNDTITVSILENNYKLRLIKIILSGIIAFILRIPVSLIVVIKVIYNRIKKFF